jgi:hypothetical protein
VQLCSYHHRLVHESGFELNATAPVGAVPSPGWAGYTGGRSCRKAVGASIERQNCARGLSIDDHTCMPRSARDPLDYGIGVEMLLARALDRT